MYPGMLRNFLARVLKGISSFVAISRIVIGESYSSSNSSSVMAGWGLVIFPILAPSNTVVHNLEKIVLLLIVLFVILLYNGTHGHKKRDSVNYPALDKTDLPKDEAMLTITEEQINAAVQEIQSSKVFDTHLLKPEQVKRAFTRFLENQIESLLEDPEYLIRNVDMHGKFGLAYAEDQQLAA